MADDAGKLREMYEAFNRGDIAAALAGINEQFEAIPPSSVGKESRYLGHNGVVRFFVMLLEPWEESQFELRELLASGDNILAEVHQRARDRETGAPFEQDMFHLWTMQDGKAVRMRVFDDREGALAALESQRAS